MRRMSENTPKTSEGAADGRPGLVLTAIGPDRPGLVNALASAVKRAGGNIEDTRMAKLGGEFAVLILVTGTEAALADLESDRTAVESTLGVSCFFKRTSHSRFAGRGLFYTLSVSALDRPGIVESVSEVLLRHGANVLSLTSKVIHAPLSGTPMFQLEADLEVPSDANLPDFRRQLAEAAERENLDHELTAGRS